MRALDRDGLRHPSRFQCVAVLVLFWIEMDFRLDNHSNMESMLTQYNHPDSPLLLYLAAFGARQHGHMHVSEERFTRVMTLVTHGSLHVMCVFELGWCCFVRGDHAACVAHLSTFLDTYQGISFRAFAAYLLGVSHMMLGDDGAARAAFMVVMDTARPNFSYDQVMCAGCTCCCCFMCLHVIIMMII